MYHVTNHSAYTRIELGSTLYTSTSKTNGTPCVEDLLDQCSYWRRPGLGTEASFVAALAMFGGGI